MTQTPAADAQSPWTLAMVAGEASGDLLAGLLLAALRERWPRLAAAGIGGPRMAAQGFQAWWPHHKLSVHGFGWDVLLRYREIVGIRKQLLNRLTLEKPRLFIGVDAPDFNLQLEENLRRQGVKTVHFVCPSVWAWRPERLEVIRRSVDHVLCIFPFEPALLARHGIAATYVGHPLAQVIPEVPDRAAARQALGLAPDDDVVAILPGSRKSEVRHLALRFFEAAARIHALRPGVKFVVPAVPGLQAQIEAAARASGMGRQIQIVAGQSHTVLAACDATLIASGTATLEAALFKRPMVIAYRMGAWSWRIMRRKKLQPWVGLPNILCQEFVVPELLQDAATADALAAEVMKWLDAKHQHPEIIEGLEARFLALHESLRRDTATLATQAIEGVLNA
ncbi:MAG: lipid-A-disaccharide synthase [Rhodoferax sp.]|nr:lipid-A-disaccharide synthase [Rhodoferax sp.]